MFKLVKLLAYAALGYFLYELYLGLTGQPAAMHRDQQETSEGGSQLGSGPNAWEGTPDRGQRVRVEDTAGASSNRYVGRGVVQR